MEVMNMQQQPILTADEVVELLRKHAIETKEEREIFEQLVNSNKLAYPALMKPSIQLPLLEKWAGFFRSRHIWVYLRRESEFGGFHYYFIVGKCGWLFERLIEQQDLLKNLQEFMWQNWEEMPLYFQAKEAYFALYRGKIDKFLRYEDRLLSVYIQSDKQKLTELCSKGDMLVEEIDAFLEKVKDLERAYALAKLL
jgi:hypothetical protein